MIDFDALVIAVGQNTFARPILVNPLCSQPGRPAYAARGVWSARPVDVMMEDSSIMVSQEFKMNIRRAEFPVMIEQGDTIEIPAAGSLPRVGICAIDELKPDGQGSVDLFLKVVEP